MKTLTDVPGFKVGHAQDFQGITGCTVILCPDQTVCAVDQRGGAPGTRETDLLRQGRLVQHVNAVLLTGGSAFGLAAADGVMQYLESNGIGHQTRGGVIPIVPTAVLFDLAIGNRGIRPGPEMGHAACKNASTKAVEQGSVGAGTGCRVGAVIGNDCATKGGVGSAAIELSDGVSVGALFAVNAVGDVIDEAGTIIAGVRREKDSHEFIDSEKVLLGGGGQAQIPLTNTVIGVIATNAKANRDELTHIATMAHDGIARSVRPSHTMFDGDTIFSLSSGDKKAHPLAIGIAAAKATEIAIRNAVLMAVSLGGVKAAKDF